MNDETAMAKPDGPTPFDLQERTGRFGEAVIAFCKTVPPSAITLPLISQLVRSATSVGANYCEANDSESKKDFRHRINTCRREAGETKHWLRMMAAANENLRKDARPLWQEAKELNLIFSAIWRKAK